jgi:hydroxymethylpyrimidine pyrophosphatase-like HAD family hydrolase
MQDMSETLRTILKSGRNIIVVSGATEEQIFKQIGEDFRAHIYVLAQNGNRASLRGGELGWSNTLSQKQKEDVFTHIENIQNTLKDIYDAVKDKNDLVQDRGCQISFSLIGHNEDIGKKEAFDPGGSRRQSFLETVPFVSENMEVKIGGTTCLDYIEKGKNKGFNVAELAKKEGWDIGECLYFGDALFKGGNDESVIGVCATQAVKDPAETLEFLLRLV